MSFVNHIEEVLRQSLQPTHLEIIDESHLHAGHAGARSGGGHYRVTVVSPTFADKTALARHRMVNQALAKELQRDIHALALQTFTPDEWERASGVSK